MNNVVFQYLDHVYRWIEFLVLIIFCKRTMGPKVDKKRYIHRYMSVKLIHVNIVLITIANALQKLDFVKMKNTNVSVLR